MSGAARLEYDKRVNRVIDHIRERLAEPLTLADLARVAAFSPFHFHRVFRAITGETLFGFIQRLRVERAAAALLGQREVSVLEIALDHGFGSAATFARAFRAHFGMTATRWRAGGAGRWRARLARKPRKQLRNAGKARGRSLSHRGRKEAAMSIRVQPQPAYHVACVFASWLPGSGYQPDDRPCYELYRGDPMVDPKARMFRCDLCLPVRPL